MKSEDRKKPDTGDLMVTFSPPYLAIATCFTSHSAAMAK